MPPVGPTLEARQRFVRGVTVLSPVSTKTLAQFQLLGDPSACPVRGDGHRLRRAAASARAGRPGARLLEHAIANLRDTSTTATSRQVPGRRPAGPVLIADVAPIADPSVKLFSVALPPLAGLLSPPPQTALDAGARIGVVLGRRSLTQPTSRVTRNVAAPAGLTDIVVVEVREEDGRIVNRRVLSSR